MRPAGKLEISALRTSNNWQLIKPIAYPALPAAVENLLQNFEQLTWHTRIPAMGQFEATPDQVLAELRDKRIAFLVRGSLGEFPIIDAAVDLAVAKRPDGYQRLGTYGGLTLFRVIP